MTIVTSNRHFQEPINVGEISPRAARLTKNNDVIPPIWVVLELACITFFSVAGGPYGFEDAVGAAGAKMVMIGLVVVPFVWSIPLALMTSELSSMFPETGGHIIWVHKAFGTFWSLQNSLWTFYTSALDNALYPVMFVDYLEEILYPEAEADEGLRWQYSMMIKLILLGFVTKVNIKGTDIVGKFAMGFAMFVLTPFLVTTVMGSGRTIRAIAGGTILSKRKKPVEWSKFFAVVFWNTSGFDCAGTCADDIPNPGYTYPRALILAVFMVFATYSIPTLVGLAYVPTTEEWTDGTFVDVADAVGGGTLGDWLGFTAAISATGMLCTLLCTTSRQLAGMSITGLFPKIFNERHPVYGTPHYAIYATSALSLVFTGFNFAILAEADMLFYCSSTILKFGALVSLRWQMPYAERPFSIPFGNLGLFGVAIPPTLACLSVVLTCRGSCLQIGIPGMLLGVITYYAKGGVRAVENMIPFDEDEDNKGGVTVDRSKEGEDLPLRVFTLDDNNSDAGDAKNALERTLSLKPHPTEHNDPFDSDGEDSKNSKDRSNAASKIN
jgi:amino acid transporter|tara:strand:+ start:782 stop:2440 length:1659 start_codon:yes stop_codon:yes gene_type:complete|mmetsp:Transcript_6639/g.19833  ORF Transcript_6639/g.19833 Transcript_6639/m.19833 type:complete len:553 (-) Transcript_6639:351-2009(-)